LAAVRRATCGLSTGDNEVGWQMSFAKLVALVEAG
jgi:hypothetical protein